MIRQRPYRAAVPSRCDEERDHHPANDAYNLTADIASEDLAQVRTDGFIRAHRAVILDVW